MLTSVALKRKFGLLEAVGESRLARKVEILQVLESDAAHEYAGEYLHMLANLADMLAKEDQSMYRFKGQILEVLCKYGDGSVQIFADRSDGVIFLASSKYGVTCFHQDPASLEKKSGRVIMNAPFKWSGFRRQAMALDEVLYPDLLLQNIKDSKPIY